MRSIYKVFLTALLIGSFVSVLPQGVQACPESGNDKSQNHPCKITNLKNSVKLLVQHKDSLSLTDKQLNQIKSIKHQAMKDIIQLKADVEIMAIDVKSAMWNKSIDAAAVSKLIDQKYAAKAKISKTYVKAIADMQGVLNDDQRAQAFDLAVASKMSGDCDMGKDCKKCKRGEDKICPITGKKLDDKGSRK